VDGAHRTSSLRPGREGKPPTSTHWVIAEWLLEYNQVLQTTPLELALQGKAEPVLTQLGRIEHGVYA
jgi:hypothetical protein